MAGYLAGMSALVGCFFAVPALRLPLTVAIGLASVAAIGYGALVHRPHRRYAWCLLGAGILAFTVGDTVYLVVAGPAGPQRVRIALHHDGTEAAARRYFGKPAAHLSDAESALLAAVTGLKLNPRAETADSPARPTRLAATSGWSRIVDALFESPPASSSRISRSIRWLVLPTTSGCSIST